MNTTTRRTVRLVNGVVMISTTDGKREAKLDGYHMTRLGSLTFHLVPFLDQIATGSKSRYVVCIDPANRSCECDGWAYHRRCKHVEAMTALRLRGKV